MSLRAVHVERREGALQVWRRNGGEAISLFLVLLITALRSRSTQRELWNNQMQIPKFMPEIPLTKSLFVSNFDMRESSQRFEHRQMCGFRLVHSGDQGVDRPK